MADSPAPAPMYDADLFAPEALRAPFEHYRALRALGPVARLAQPDVHVLSRYDMVRDALRAPDALISGEGVGFSDAFNRPGAPNIINSDGELHARLRAEVLRPLTLGQLRQHRALLKDMIVQRIDALVGGGPFDAMEAIARVLPLQAISLLVGLPEEGRAAMLEWAGATFNAIGPDRPDFASDVALLAEARLYLAGQSRATVRDGSWTHALFAAVEAGRLSEAEARGAMSAYVLPSLDTTILAKGHLLHLLARSPEQWAMLRRDPALIPGAVIESVRHSAVIRWFARVAHVDYDAGGHVIPAGARVMLIYASANRDERRFAEPDRFDIRRDAGGQLSWGTGRHMCAGLHLARIEMEVMLEALVERCGAIEAEAPMIGANRGLYGFERLTMTLH